VDDPKLNTIGTPSGVQNVKGRKKGKRFINEDTVHACNFIVMVEYTVGYCGGGGGEK
jgi:hypothetical protein